MKFKDLYENIKNIDDIYYGLYSFLRDPLNGKYSRIEKIDLIKKAQECGVKYAENIKIKYKNKDILEILSDFKIKFNNISEENTGYQVIFAQFTEPNKIEIFKKHIRITKEKFRDNEIYFQYSDEIEKILIAHELFHFLEFRDKKEIFTKVYKLNLWNLFNIYHHKSNLICLSEIAAMSFSKELLNLEYNPFMLDILMVYPYNEKYAIDLYNDLLDVMEEKNDS